MPVGMATAISDGALPFFVPVTVKLLQISMNDAVNNVTLALKGTDVHINTLNIQRDPSLHTQFH